MNKPDTRRQATNHTCACKCGCPHGRRPDCNNLCEDCWREWCQGSENHHPLADSSYLATYGITNIWTGWLISQAPHLAAQPPLTLQRPEAAPRCPLPCGARMVRRPGGWKCYRHQEPVALPEKVHFPRSPSAKVIGL